MSEPSSLHLLSPLQYIFHISIPIVLERGPRQYRLDVDGRYLSFRYVLTNGDAPIFC